MKKFFLGLLVFVLLLIAVIFSYGVYQFRDRHSGYWVDLKLESSTPVTVKAGFAKVDISPTLTDTWVDANKDSRYNPEDGDTYTDVNGNGKFDGVWLAGFHNGRAAQGILDPLWARAMVLDDGEHQIALCVIDMIGFGNDEVIQTRKMIEESNSELDYVIVASTHVHSSPDLMGMWGASDYERGVDPAYLELVQKGIESAVNEAFEKRESAVFKFTQENEKLKPLVGDTRDPQVFDPALKLMQVLSRESGETLGTIMNWGNHPETLWLENTLVTSDFADPWRNMVEKGLTLGDSTVIDGVGGVAIFLNGAIGGLMTTHPSMEVVDPLTKEGFQTQDQDKLLAQGRALAKITLETLADSNALFVEDANLNVRAKSLELRMDNQLFHLAAFLGIFDRGFTKWKHIRSEVSAWTIGPATFVHAPGELYPEILHGGVDAPEGADFGIAPIEVPALQSQIPGQVKFFAGMSNDMVGYIIPKSQWDVEAPFTYQNENRPYGEINSLGPETGPTIYQAILDILREL
ncbi:hypothetical protein ACFOSV_14415 [Algoriphagus namhaensis]|uniref:Neutral/alkaline non-lysosomal ceramidase N-terminal domain-containing protein n=1 Tax=Algoriphagus namhaensis TaxID=915353 RepID=A0ABV8AX43_9BACT